MFTRRVHLGRSKSTKWAHWMPLNVAQTADRIFDVRFHALRQTTSHENPCKLLIADGCTESIKRFSSVVIFVTLLWNLPWTFVQSLQSVHFPLHFPSWIRNLFPSSHNTLRQMDIIRRPWTWKFFNFLRWLHEIHLLDTSQLNDILPCRQRIACGNIFLLRNPKSFGAGNGMLWLHRQLQSSKKDLERGFSWRVHTRSHLRH